MAEGRKLCVIEHVVDFEPPASQERSHERGEKSADVDEHIKDLEA